MLTIESLTGGEKEGRGSFDELMRTVKSHVQMELKEGRITERNYSEMYLAALQSTLGTANDYTLKYQTVNKNLEMLDEQIKQNQKQNELLELQKEQLRINNATAQYNLQHILPEQLNKLRADNALVQAQTDLVNAQLREMDAKIALIGKQEDLVDEQIRDAKDKHTTPTGGLNLAAYEKVQAELNILHEKLLTEMANTKDVVNGLPVKGIVGKEMQLKQNQADSFLRNAEIQAGKLYTDTFAVMYSTNAEGMDNQAFGLGSDESFQVLKKIAAGIGADGGFDHDHPAPDLPSTGGQ